MAVSDAAKQYYDKMFPGETAELLETDPEFAELFMNFAFDQVVNEEGQELPDETRWVAIMSTLIGCQGMEEYKKMLPAALNFGVSPIVIKEVVYQAVAYLGMGRVYPFLKITNDILKERGISLPLEKQGTASADNRRERGTEKQVEIFGDQMNDFWKGGHINYWLASNCFGDYYTRGGLDVAQREMITFCFLAAQGGCEPQLTAHAVGNMRVGNDKEFLIRVASQCMPYIGYPRTLNAIACINKAAEQIEG